MDDKQAVNIARKPGPRPQVVDRVSRELRSRLARGDYPADSYLPSERQLSSELNVGRASVAAAIQSLANLGLVDRHQGRGSYIKPKSGKTVAIIHTLYPGSNPIWNEAICLLQGVRSALEESSMDVQEVSRSDWCKDPKGAIGDSVAVLMIKLDDNMVPMVLDLLNRDVPCVIANLEQNYPDLAASYVDHRAVTGKATQMLIDMGHRRIGYVGNEPEHWFYASAIAGYETALRENNMPVEPALIEQRTDSMALAGYLGTRAMLERDNPPTAIVAARDGYAEGVCKAANELGRNISVFGYDDLTWPREPDFMTTFKHPGVELGRAAADMLLDWIHTGRRPDNRKIEAPLVMRRSVSPLPVSPF